MAAKAKKDWKKVCLDIASMRKSFDDRNREAASAQANNDFCISAQQFLKTTMYQGAAEEFVQMKQLFARYQSTCRGPVHLGDFRKVVITTMGNAFKNQHNFIDHAGRRRNLKSVVLGYRL